MANSAAADVPLLITSDQARSERRVNPSWTIAQLKARLEPITGVPAGCQRLALRVSASEAARPLEADDEETTPLARWPLVQYAEIVVTDTRPPNARANYTDVSAVEKFEMSAEDYASRSDTVLAYKQKHRLGRFDPNAPTIVEAKARATNEVLEERQIAVGSRCRLLPATDHRRGTVRFTGPVDQLPGPPGAAWVGIELDEPTGKNDGSVGEGADSVRYFQCGRNCGSFVRPERVEVGDFPPLDDFADDDDDDDEF